MPKKVVKKGRISPKVEKQRNAVTQDLFELKKDYVEHIKAAMRSEAACNDCFTQHKKDKEGNILFTVLVPTKAKDKDGQCRFCHGTGVVPNESQRNWGAVQLGLRIAPAPKTMESSTEEITDFDEFEKELLEKPDEEIRKMARDLGIDI